MQFLQHLMATREEMFREPLIDHQEKTNKRKFLAAVSQAFPESVRSQVLMRCEYLLTFMHMMILNYPIMKAGLEESGLPHDDDSLINQFAKIAEAALREYENPNQ